MEVDAEGPGAFTHPAPLAHEDVSMDVWVQEDIEIRDASPERPEPQSQMAPTIDTAVAQQTSTTSAVVPRDGERHVGAPQAQVTTPQPLVEAPSSESAPQSSEQDGRFNVQDAAPAEASAEGM